MKTALAAATIGLASLVMPTPPTSAVEPVHAEVSATTARGPGCDIPGVPCQHTEVGLTGPTRPVAPRTRVRYTCSVHAGPTTERPEGTFTLRVGHQGETFWRSTPKRVPSARSRDILTRRMPTGLYNVRCFFKPRETGGVYQAARSGSRRLTVR